MALDINKFQRLKEAVTQAQSEADRLAGALEQTMGRLQEEFGCETLPEAREHAAILTQEADEAETKFNDGLAAFEKKYENVLNLQDAD